MVRKIFSPRHCRLNNIYRYFNRDVECIRSYFRRRFQYESSFYPRFKSTMVEDNEKNFQLDVMVAASGFAKKDMKTLEDVVIALFYKL